MLKKVILAGSLVLATIFANAQVGIGTTSPSNALDVETNEAGGTAIDINNTGTGDPKINLQVGGTTKFSIGVDNDDADKLKIGVGAPETSTRMTIDGSGNVGIGTSSPTQKLDISGELTIHPDGTSADNIYNGSLIVTKPSVSGQYINLVRLGQYPWSIGTVYNSSTFAIGQGKITDSDFITPYFSITNVSGNVGIGTSSPSEKLDIESSDATKTAVDINNTGGGDPKINLQINGTTTFSIGIDNSDADKLKIGTTAPETNTRLTIDASGNVGIGTTTPTALLTVNGNIYMPASSTEARSLEIGNGRTGNGNSYIDFIGDATYTDYGLRIIRNNNGANSDANILNRGTGILAITAYDAGSIDLKTNNTARLSITSEGLVGIGTSSPSEILDIQSSDANKTAVDINNTGGGDPKINLQVGGTTTFSIGIDNSDADKLKIGTSALETNTRVTIDATGNVGVGTTTPGAKLDVDGSAIFNESGAAVNFRVESDANANMLFIDGTNNRVGVGTGTPDATFQVNGSFKLVDGNQSNGKVLTSDANGVATWQTASGGSLPAGTSGQTLRHNGTTWVANSNIFNNGTNVGIGTTSPASPLEVVSATQNNRVISATDGTSWISIVSNLGGIGYNNISQAGDIGLIFSTDNDFTASASNGLVIAPHANAASGLKIMEDGKVGIGTGSPGYTLTVNGQPGANGYTAFTNYSDSRLKTNVSSLDTGVLGKIMQLSPVSFQYNDKYLQLYPNSDLNKVHKGFIAQEIQQVFPEMVSEMKTSPDSVKYLDLDVSHLQVYLVKALQEQQAIIQAQKKENESQKAEIESLKADASNTSAETNQKLAELEAKLNALLQLIQQQESVSVVK